MRKRGNIVLAAVFVTVICMLFAGCKKDETGAGKGKKSGEPVVLTALSDSAQAGFLRNFNPFTNPLNLIQGFVYEYLVLFNEMKNKEEVMWLAEEIISEPDLQTLTIKVREGIKWSDGTPFTAADVAFTFLITKDHPEIDFQSDWGEKGKMESVTLVDDKTVVIKMKEKNAFHRIDVFDQRMIIPKHVWGKFEQPASEILENPVGTGPFTEVITFNPQIIILGRNKSYWKGDQLKIDQIKVPNHTSPEATYTLFESGQVDWAESFIPNIEKIYIQGDPDRKYWFPSNDGVRITINFQTKDENNRKAFNDINFRRAFLMAMDRKSMMEVGAYGYVKGGNNPTNLPSGLWGWRNPEADKEWNKYFKYDVARAKAALSEGGFKDVDGDGFVENADGTPVKFDILVPSGWTDWVNNCQIAVEGLRKAGINASVRTPELQTYIDVWATGEHDSIFGATINRATIWKFYYDVVHSRNNLSNTWWTSTMNNYSNKGLDSKIETMPLTIDEKKHMEVAKEIEMVFAREILHFPLYYNAQWFEYNTSRFTGWPDESNPYVAPTLSNHDNKLILILNLQPKA